MWLFQPLLPAAAQQQAGPAVISGSASQTLGVAQIAAGTVDVQGAASQTLGITQTAAGTVDVQGAASETLGITQTAAGIVDVQGAASQTLGIAQAAAGAVSGGDISGSAAQILGLAQTATGTVDVQGVASQTLGITQTAAGAVGDISGTATQVLAITQTATGTSAQPAPIRLAVQKAVYEAAQTALASLAVPVYDHPPHSQAAPFVVFDMHQTVPLDGADMYGYTHQFYLSVWSDYRGAREVETILAALRSGLHDQTITLETGTCALCQVSDQRSQRDVDGLTYQGAMTLSLMTVLPEAA